MLTVEKAAYHTQAPFIMTVEFIHTFSRPPHWQAFHHTVWRTPLPHAGPPLPAKFTKIYKVRKLTSVILLIGFHVIFVPHTTGCPPHTLTRVPIQSVCPIVPNTFGFHKVCKFPISAGLLPISASGLLKFRANPVPQISGAGVDEPVDVVAFVSAALWRRMVLV